MKDLFGRAILDFQTNNNPQQLITETSISEPDPMDVAYLFRPFNKMPKIEQLALTLSRGKVLDIGCGAGSHSLYLQQRGFEVLAVDVSHNAIAACRLRGIENAIATDFMALENMQFDTILLLMNGTGICGQLSNMPAFLTKLKSLLAPKGQILIDSSNIIYMFDTYEDGETHREAALIEANFPSAEKYYGEIEFTISYKGETDAPFSWLYLDYDTLQNLARTNGLQCEMLLEGEHYDYLARLSI